MLVAPTLSPFRWLSPWKRSETVCEDPKSEVTEVLVQAALLQLIFSHLPLSSGKKICCVSKLFCNEWYKTRYLAASQQIVFSPDYSETLKPLLLSFTENCLNEPWYDTGRPFLRAAHRATKKALTCLTSSDTTIFFPPKNSTENTECYRELWQRVVSLLNFSSPSAPNPSDLLEDPELLFEVLQRARKNPKQDTFWVRFSKVIDELPHSIE